MQDSYFVLHLIDSMPRLEKKAMIKKIENMIHDLTLEMMSMDNGQSLLSHLSDSQTELYMSIENSITELENVLQAYADLD